MIKKLAIFGFAFFTLATCQSQKKKSKSSISKEKVKKQAPKILKEDESNLIYLNEGQNIFLKTQEMNVTFKNISEDSRCPKEVDCIWAGVAVANIEFMGTYTRPTTVSLATANNIAKNYSNFTIFNGYKITLKQVSPYPTSEGAKNLKGNYKIGLLFEKTNQTKPDPTTERGGISEK